MRALGWTATPSLNHFPVTFSSDTSHLNTACSADFTVRSAMLCSTCSSLSEAKTPTWINTNKCLFTTDNSSYFGQGQVAMCRLTIGWKCIILPEETQYSYKSCTAVTYPANILSMAQLLTFFNKKKQSKCLFTNFSFFFLIFFSECTHFLAISIKSRSKSRLSDLIFSIFFPIIRISVGLLLFFYPSAAT